MRAPYDGWPHGWNSTQKNLAHGLHTLRAHFCLINNFTFYIDLHAEIQTRSKVNYAALCNIYLAVVLFPVLMRWTKGFRMSESYYCIINEKLDLE